MLLCGTLFAHHGTPAYDLAKTITSKATVTSMEWNNPHCLLHFDIRDVKGIVHHWTVELYNPLYMTRAGWSKDTLRAGDEINISFHPAKNGATNGIVRVGEGKIVSNGQSLSLDEDKPFEPARTK
jgi:hypothetical protein